MSDSATDQAKPTRPLFRVPFASDGNAARFLRGAGGTLVVQVAGAGLLFASQAVFARFLGVESFGIYVLAYAWLNVLLLAARQGFDVATVRFVAAYRAKSEWGLFRGYLGFSRAIVLAASVAIAGAMALATWWFRSRLGDEAAWAFWFAAATLPLFAQAQVHEAAIRGLGTVVRPLIFLRLLHPALLAVVLPLAVLGFGVAPTANVGMAIYLLATAVSLAGLWAMLRARCPQAAHGARPATEPRKWLNASFAMMFLMSFGPILNQICVIVLGALDGNAAAGQYGAAVRISYIVQPLIIAQTIAIAPLAADLHARGDVA